MKHTQLYIGGTWRDASDGGQFSVINPMDESHLADVSSATITDALAAMDAADAAFKDWRSRSPRARGEILRRAFDLFTQRLEDFAYRGIQFFDDISVRSAFAFADKVFGCEEWHMRHWM